MQQKKPVIQKTNFNSVINMKGFFLWEINSNLQTTLSIFLGFLSKY